MRKVPDHIKPVLILNGSVEHLCGHRELRTKYETNRSIKTWAAYFLMKSLTSSGVIQKWISQKQELFSFCKMNENTFRARLTEMIQLQLATLDKNTYNITLTSYSKAAGILGIEYTGTTKIQYDTSIEGKQIFQYILRGEEIRNNQIMQLEALCYYADKNPLLKANLMHLLSGQGCSEEKLKSCKRFFQEQLLLLQQKAFKEGSAIVSIIHQLRADINRSVKKIKEYHNYKSAQSVSYMKKVMKQLSLITVTKKVIESKERTRLYVPDYGDKFRDGYKWLPNKKVTAWVLTDQIQLNFSSNATAKKQPAASEAA